MTRISAVQGSLLLGATLLLASVPASAVPVVSDSMTVTDAAGAIITSITTPEDPNECKPGFACFYELSIGVNHSTLPTILTDPDGSLSDIIGIASNAPDFLSYSSDPNIALDLSFYGIDLSNRATYVLLPEGDGTFDATAYLTADEISAGDHATFFSDVVEETTGVPEPGTLAVFGVGVLGLGAMRRRRKVSV